jgi:dCTP deaminase
MILSDREIRAAIKQRHIVIDPQPAKEQYNTSALDLRLGDELLELRSLEELQQAEPAGVERTLIIDLAKVRMTGLLQAYAKPFARESDGSFILPSGRFALGITREWIELPRRSKIAARVEGRSTLARLGLAVHMTAPTIHAGFEGRIVLEMYNFGPYPLRLRPREFAVCQLIFERLGRTPSGQVKTTYKGQKSIR